MRASSDSSWLSERLSAISSPLGCPSLTPPSSPLTRLLSDFHLIRLFFSPPLPIFGFRRTRARTHQVNKNGTCQLVNGRYLPFERRSPSAGKCVNCPELKVNLLFPHFAFSNGAALVSHKLAVPPASQNIIAKCKTFALAAYVRRCAHILSGIEKQFAGARRRNVFLCRCAN